MTRELGRRMGVMLFVGGRGGGGGGGSGRGRWKVRGMEAEQGSEAYRQDVAIHSKW